MTADQIVGMNVHHILWGRGIKQRAFAYQIGVDESLFSKRLRGRSAWSAQDILDVAGVLGIEPGKLLEQPTVAKFPQQVPSFCDEPGGSGVRRSLRVVRDLDPRQP